MKPMLAATVKDWSSIKYPVYALPKVDAVRALGTTSGLRSRALKPFPNTFVMTRFSDRCYAGLDGELVVGPPTSEAACRETAGACSSPEGEPDATLYVFDVWDSRLAYRHRIEDALVRCAELPHVQVLPCVEAKDEQHLRTLESEWLSQGYEGVILRDPEGLYKFGRSTAKEGGMLKLKRFEDAEAVIVGWYEGEHNANPAETSELGRTKRSHRQEGMVPKGVLGGWILRDDKNFPGVTFRCGSGIDALEAAFWWLVKEFLLGATVKYKFQRAGTKDRPRSPVFLGGREEWDL